MAGILEDTSIASIGPQIAPGGLSRRFKGGACLGFALIVGGCSGYPVYSYGGYYPSYYRYPGYFYPGYRPRVQYYYTYNNVPYVQPYTTYSSPYVSSPPAQTYAQQQYQNYPNSNSQSSSVARDFAVNVAATASYDATKAAFGRAGETEAAAVAETGTAEVGAARLAGAGAGAVEAEEATPFLERLLLFIVK